MWWMAYKTLKWYSSPKERGVTFICDSSLFEEFKWGFEEGPE